MLNTIPKNMFNLLYRRNSKNMTINGKINYIRHLYSHGLVHQQDEFYKQELERKNLKLPELERKQKTLLDLINKNRENSNFQLGQARQERREVMTEKTDIKDTLTYHREINHDLLNKISSEITSQFSSKRNLEILLGTLSIAYETNPKNQALRIKRNTESKPIYMSAISALLIQNLIENNYKFNSKYVSEIIQKHEDNETPNSQEMFTEIQKPLVKGIYLQYLGHTSPSSKIMTETDSPPKILTTQEREKLLKLSKNAGKIFFENAVDAIPPKFDTHQEKEEFEKGIESQLSFITSTITSLNNSKSEIGQLLKVCQVYTSFMLPDKPRVVENSHIKAYDIMIQLAKDKKINPIFTSRLLSMMGKFPLGTGLYFFDQDNKSIDKVIVTRTNPENPNEPITKRTLKKFKKVNESEELIISQKSNLYFKEIRRKFDINKTNFRVQFNEGDENLKFYWKPNESLKHGHIDEDKVWEKKQSRRRTV